MPHVFSGFQDVTLIGEGGLGRVHRAVRTSTGGVVAIKELRDVGEGSSAGHRARRELEALLRLKGHPHVVSVEEILDGDRGPALVMEFAPGGALIDRLADGPMATPQLVLVADHVLQALDAAHRIGIVHRDIKPHNLLVGAFGQVKVCDFGIAALARGPGQRTQTQALTLAYASPEEIDGHSDIGPAADVYSLGATLLHLAIGRPLTFAERAMPAQLSATLAPAGPASGEDVRRSLLDICLACLAFAPGDRPTVHQFAAACDEMGARLGPRRLRILPEADHDDATTVVRRPAERPAPPAATPSAADPPNGGTAEAAATVPRTSVPSSPLPPPIRPLVPPAPIAAAPAQPNGPELSMADAVDQLATELRELMAEVLGAHRADEYLGLFEPLDHLSPLRRPKMLARAQDMVRLAMQRAAAVAGWEHVDGLILPVSWLAAYEALADSDDDGDVPAIVALIEETGREDTTGVEIAYDIREWDQHQFSEVTNSLTRLGVHWYLDGQELLVDPTDEAAVDWVIESVTGAPPTPR